jgi:acetyl-CoA carboxylase biotin carboxyl carrier protein
MTFDEVKELIAVFGESALSSIKIENENFKIKLDKNIGVSVPAPAATIPAAVQVPSIDLPTENTTASAPVSMQTINSPMVGTFYSSPSPDSSAYVKVGDNVKKGQTLAIIEAMKIMNEIEAEFDCKIVEILVEDGQAVEYDSPLFGIERI